jgi:hypothetical protein
MITLRFADRLPAAAVRALGTGAGTPSAERIAALPADLQATIADAFGQAVPPVFGYDAPLLGLALALPARPLRDTAHADEHLAEDAR